MTQSDLTSAWTKSHRAGLMERLQASTVAELMFLAQTAPRLPPIGFDE